MIYKALHNYFIPCHRKCIGQHSQYDSGVAYDGKVGCNTAEYKMALLYSDWL